MDNTTIFKISDIETAMISKILIEVYESLKIRGYNPMNQIIGYLITGDSSYITAYNNARSKIIEFNREKILEVVFKDYMKNIL